MISMAKCEAFESSSLILTQTSIPLTARVFLGARELSEIVSCDVKHLARLYVYIN